MEKSSGSRNRHFGLVRSHLRGPAIRGCQRRGVSQANQRTHGGLLGMLEVRRTVRETADSCRGIDNTRHRTHRMGRIISLGDGLALEFDFVGKR